MTQTLASDANNDLVLDSAGNVRIATGIEAVAFNCKTAMQAQRGEMMFAVDKGMPMMATAWDRYNPVQFEAAARTVLKEVPEVLGVDSFTVARTDERLVYTATIRTTYGETVIDG